MYRWWYMEVAYSVVIVNKESNPFGHAKVTWTKIKSVGKHNQCL